MNKEQAFKEWLDTQQYDSEDISLKLAWLRQGFYAGFKAGKNYADKL